MRRSSITVLLIPLSLFVFAAPAWASAGQMDLGTIMDTLRTTASNFGSAILPYAKWLLYSLVTIDVAWTFLKAILNGDDMLKQISTLILRIMWIGFLLLLIRSPYVLKEAVNGFIVLGQKGAGVSSISPSSVFWEGINLLQGINAHFAEHSTLLAIYPALVNLLITIIVFMCFAYIAAQFALTYVELWFYLAVYPLILALGSTPWSKQYAMNTILKPVSFGLRFMVLYFVMGVTMTAAKVFETTITNMSGNDLTAAWSVAGGCIVLLLLAMKAPQLASDLLSNNLSLSAGDGVGAAVVAGGAIAAGASSAKVATKAAGVASSGLAAAAQVGQAGMSAAQSSGAQGMKRFGVAGSAIGTAGAQVIRESVGKLGSSNPIGRVAQRVSENAAGGITGGGSGTPASTPTPRFVPDISTYPPRGARPGQGSVIQSAMSHVKQMGTVQQQPDAPETPGEEA